MDKGYGSKQQLVNNNKFIYEFQRPTSNYTCSFCKRQFRSAQALGGHMNVHRRDRARLRLLPPWFFDRNPNPNPNLISSTKPPSSSSSSSSTSKFLTYHHPHTNQSSLVSPSPRRSRDEKKKFVDYLPSPNLGSHQGVNGEMKSYALNGGEGINLNLEIGIFKDPQEILDLDLRLGSF